MGETEAQSGEARAERSPESAQSVEEFLLSMKGQPALYHCVSRVVDRRKVLGAEERSKFVEFMREYEAFCQVRVWTFCVMGNHFHILVEVPEAPEDRGRSWSDDKFLRHVSNRYHGEEYAKIANKLAWWRERGLDSEAEKLRGRYFARMWDLSWFLRLLKQRFTQWFNWKHGRDGYLWSDRFRSLLVESGRAARMVAAYIDLNPVRAGLVKDPADWPWSGWAEALSGDRRAREGIRMVVFDWLGVTRNEQLAAQDVNTWEKTASWYRATMFMDAEESERDRRKNRAGISAERVAEVLEDEGLKDEARMVRERVPAFTEAKVIGGSRFVDSVGAIRLGRIPVPLITWKEEQESKARQLAALRGSRKASILEK
jgi:REP element-mobilizing transposase RayT